MFMGRNDVELFSFAWIKEEEYAKVKNLAIVIYNVQECAGYLARIWSAGADDERDYPTNIIVRAVDLDWLRADIRKNTPCRFYYYDFEWNELKEVWL